MLYRVRGLNQQEVRGSSLGGSGFWATVERGKGRPAGIQSPQQGGGSGWDHPCTCIVRLRGRHTERARVGTDWPISGRRRSLALRWSGRRA